MADTVAFLVKRGVPVMAHIGLTPQAINTLGGFKTQGKDDAAVEMLVADGKAMEAAGAFSIVIEGVMESAAKKVIAGHERDDHRHWRLGRLRWADPCGR